MKGMKQLWFWVLGAALAWQLPAAHIVRFQIQPSTIGFPNQSPDLVPEIPGQVDLLVDIFINQLESSETWRLELFAGGDLTSGADTIPIENVRWQIGGVSDPPATLTDGRFSRGVYVQAAMGNGDPQNRQARAALSISFFLQNLWTYAPGNYFRDFTLRLTVPGDTAQQVCTLTADVQPWLDLELGTGLIRFLDANPDTLSSIPAPENPVTVTTRARVGSVQAVNLACQAAGDLTSATDIIPISAVTWTAVGNGFYTGTMNKVTPQSCGSWNGPGLRSGSFSYFLANSWSYNSGIYAATVTYTLSNL